MRIPKRVAPFAALATAALLAPAGASAQTYPKPQQPAPDACLGGAQRPDSLGHGTDID